MTDKPLLKGKTPQFLGDVGRRIAGRVLDLILDDVVINSNWKSSGWLGLEIPKRTGKTANAGAEMMRESAHTAPDFLYSVCIENGVYAPATLS